MIREAELFVMAEQVLVEVLGRIRDEHRGVVLPPLFPADRATPLPEAVRRYAADEASVPGVLSGRPVDEPEPAPVVPHATLVRLIEASCGAAREVTDAGAATAGGVGPVGDHLVRLAIARSFLAHDIAFGLGSTACPLTEELARGLWERTEPEAERWRARGVFTEPLLPLPPDVSWRDRFLMCAGRDPHPVH